MFYILSESNIYSKKDYNFHLIMSEKNFLKKHSFFDSILFVNESCYEGKINNYNFKILVISEEVSSPFLKLYYNLCKINLPKTNTILGEISLLNIDLNRNFNYSNHEILDLITIIANKIKYSLDDFEQLQNYIQGIKIREYFFKGYKKTRYIAHDRIHHWVAQSLNLEQPTVTNLLFNYTQVLEKDFNQLLFSKKESLLIEESIVLAFERTLIRQRAESIICTQELKKKFFQFNKDNPCLIRLNELSEPGKIGDHPEWMALWAKGNKKRLESSLQIKLETVNQNFPKSFDNYLEFLKNKYAYKNISSKPIDNSNKINFTNQITPSRANVYLRNNSFIPFFNNLSSLGISDMPKLPRYFFRR